MYVDLATRKHVLAHVRSRRFAVILGAIMRARLGAAPGTGVFEDRTLTQALLFLQ